MEVLQQLQTMLNSGYSVFVAVAAVAAVLFKMTAQVFRAMEWHDKHFVKKRLAHLKAIRSSSAKNPQLTQYLDEAIELEVFRIASGINTSRTKMDYLLSLGQEGRWNRSQLRSLSKFVFAEPGKSPSLQVSVFDRIGAGISAIAAFSTLTLGAVYAISLSVTAQPLTTLAGMVLFGIALLFGRFLATDLIDYLVVARALKHLLLSPSVH